MKNSFLPIDACKDFASGCFSGCIQVFVMQPFQMIKVRLVNQSLLKPQYKGILDCFKKIYKNQGFAAFYKGSLAPLLGIGALVSLQFGSNELIKKLIQKVYQNNFKNQQINELENFSFGLILASGLLTGIPSSLAVTPIDHTRILMQVKHSNLHKFHGSMDAGIKIYKQYGVKGLYLGFYPTILRQTIALSTYFGIYELIQAYCKSNLESNNFAMRRQLVISFLAGGLAGCGSWLFTYPIDYIKTLIQSQNLQSRKYKSSIDCVMKKYGQQGIRTFFKGLGVTMMRSFPVNGCGFMAFEFMMRRLGRRNEQI